MSSPVTPIAVVGVSAIMPQAPSADLFWQNIKNGAYSITETPFDRWDPAKYYDVDRSARDKTYSKIGGWVHEFDWNPVAWRLPIPPTVALQMDEGQRWAISAARAALVDAGWPEWNVDGDRVGVILGNAIGGEKHYVSSNRIRLPELLAHFEAAPSMMALPVDVQKRILAEARISFQDAVPDITEDTMPGELSNVIAGRVANLFNLRGPNFTTDAACASGLAALSAAVHGLRAHECDAMITGAIDRNMGIEAYVKFCKIGALSASGTRPFDAGADGFVMGEGCAVFVLKRLEDAERDGDRIQAVILGIGGSSDGKGKGITAPNPVGQQHAIRRAWEYSGLDPATASVVEAHGTSTRVGDAAELASLTAVFGHGDATPRSIALGSVKSNIGHLKAAAGSAGMFKMIKMLDDKLLAPSLNFKVPNDNVDWDTIPFAVNTQLRSWDASASPDGVRRGGISAFGFGGTNFHVVLEEYVPGRYRPEPTVHASAAIPASAPAETVTVAASPTAGRAADGGSTTARKVPLRGALVLGGADDASVRSQVEAALTAAQNGQTPAPSAPDPALASAAVRVAVDYADAAELATKLTKLTKAFASSHPAGFRLLRQQGIFVGRGPAPKVAFLYTGQGSQYVNMLASLREAETIVRDRFAAADAVMAPLLGKPLSEFIFTDAADERAVQELTEGLMQTEVTQPAVLATDLALTEMLGAYGVLPDMVMGHSLGEYGALVAAGSLGFEQALEAVSARGAEMKKVSMADNGAMAAVFGPLEDIQRTVDATDGYVVVANINSGRQAVVGGATDAVENIIETFLANGLSATRIPVSHAFHTSIVAPASAPFVNALRRLDLRPPGLPIVANVTGEFYPPNATTETMLEFAGRQIASPVQFVKGLQTLYDSGARVFVEVGPKKALHGFVEDVLGARDDVVSLFTNHPKIADDVAFNQALCGLYAAGLGLAAPATPSPTPAPAPAHSLMAHPVPASTPASPASMGTAFGRAPGDVPVGPVGSGESGESGGQVSDDTIRRLGELFAGVLAEGLGVYRGDPAIAGHAVGTAPEQAVGPSRPGRAAEPVVITGASLGLPGRQPTFDDENVSRLLAGTQFIDAVPQHFRDMMLDQRITRVVKDESGGGSFQRIDSSDDVIKLAGMTAPFDVVEQYGVDKNRDEAYDTTTRMAVAVGFDALRDAGIPLVMRYKTTTLGTQLPDRWLLPESLRDDTGIIFASVFPGYDRFAEALEDYFTDRGRRQNLLALEGLKTRMAPDNPAQAEVDVLIAELRAAIDADDHHFDRRFLLRVLSMGHSQFADLIGCRGPNTQINAACASTTQAVALAEDWIRAGRCRRVIVLSADDATSEKLLPWITSGFIATGAAATDERVEDAATPFDARRHGMIVGAGAAALVVESADAARERGVQPICELLGSVISNSAFHATRLDVDHICGVMESLVSEVEARGYSRAEIAPRTVFVSHETYTPARGGSAAAEIEALRQSFGPAADQIVITNTKGFTGHAMGAGIEDALAVKALEAGIVPPVPNYKVPDPSLGQLNLSRGGSYPVEFALRLAAGFGSQIAMAMFRWTPMPDGRHRAPSELGYAYRVVDPGAWQRWLDSLSGQTGSTLEVDHRRLRLTDRGAAPTPSQWRTRVPVPYAEEFGGARPTSPLAAPAAPAAAPVGRAAPGTGVPAAAVVAAAAAPGGAVPVSPVAPVAPVAPVVSAPTVSVVAPVDEILAKVTAIVAEMTGYPTELLDPDLDLEADLGVDTVKQAEVFAAVRGEWALERDEDLRLRDFPTLRHVAGYVRGRLGLPEPSAAATASTASGPAGPGAPAGAVDSAASVVAPVDEILAKVTAIVAEMTGYPTELLDPDLDLEADLGVDTVKQAEVFAAVRGEYALERDDNLQLREFPTLNHVAGWVRGKLGSADPSADGDPARSGPVATATSVSAPSLVAGDLDAVDALPRRIPVPSLRPALDACTATGVDLEGARVVVMLDEGGVGAALLKRLGKAGATALVLEPGVSTEDLDNTLETWRGEAPITGVYWLAGLDDERELASYDLDGWHEATRRRVKSLYRAMRRLWDDSPFLVSATYLGGYHGYDAAGATGVLGGSVTGFTKSYKKERPDALVKAVDLPASRKTATVADLLIAETLADPGCVEIGLVGGRRYGVGFVEIPFGERDGDDSVGEGGLPLTPDTVFAVTGAAGSIVSAITADLAKASQGTFHLLDLTPTPDAQDPDIAAFRSDRNSLKGLLARRMTERGDKPTPVAIEREIAGIERRSAALDAIEAVQAAGGTAHYYSVDLTDVDGVGAAISEVLDTSGRIDVLLHAAGVEISRNLPEKEPREYDLVFDVKCDGWFALRKALADQELKATAVFSSVAGRFGNQGQTDYSAANDLMCKAMSNLRNTTPGTRGLALDWTAWGGIGMATRGSIPTIMAAAGVEVLPPEAGVAWIRRELTDSAFSGEVIVAGALGMMAQEYDTTGGLDVGTVADTSRGPMIGDITTSVHSGWTSKVTLDPIRQPFLNDHRIDGIAVLPGVMGMESFAEVAALAAPADYRVAAVEDVEFAAPVKFFRDGVRELTVSAVIGPDPSGGGDLLARCSLTAERSLPGQEAPVVTTHFRGTVRLTEADVPKVEKYKGDLAQADAALDAGQVYTFYFHGPAYQVVESAWRNGVGSTARLAADLPANSDPADAPLVTAPRLVELCFQTAGLWQAGRDELLALPQHVGRVRVLSDEATAAQPLTAHAEREPDGSFDVVVVDAKGKEVVRLEGYRTIEMPAPLPPEVAPALRAAYGDGDAGGSDDGD